MRLSGVETDDNNRLRIRLRRINGLLMCMMAACLFLGTASLEKRWSAAATAILWLAVIVLMFAIAMLALVDLRLTRLRRELRKLQLDEPPLQ